MKTLQRQNTKREIVKKVRFSKNIADANSGMLKKYAPNLNPKRATLDNKEEDEFVRSQISIVPIVPIVPVAASDSHSSLDTEVIITETTETIAAADTVALVESGKSQQHENAITLSLTE
jgi:hypothetical protein